MQNQKDAMVINDPRSLKALSEPLRVQLLKAFGESPKTTKQLGEMLGIQTNKLYHHVEVLHEAGLIELVARKPKRGTIEKYFRPVAKRFLVNPILLEPELDPEEGTESDESIIVRSGQGLSRKELDKVRNEVKTMVDTMLAKRDAEEKYSYVAVIVPVGEPDAA